MKRSANRILTTHTGSLPRTAQLVELLLADDKNPGARKAELDAAVREAVADRVRHQIECGLDIINDGEQGRPDYTVHVMRRLTGFEGKTSEPLGTGDAEFPELAEMLKPFASPFQHRPACNGPVTWKDWPAAQADIDIAREAMVSTKREEFFMTSPSPGQIARYLKNDYYPSDEAYIYALADVMRREYTAIVEAGLILQLDCPDLAMLRHTVYPNVPLADYRKIIAVNVAALNHAVRDLPAERMRMHVCWGSTMAPRHTDVEMKDIVDIILQRQAAGVVVPGRQRPPRARMEDLARGEAARRQDHHPGRDRFHRQHRRAPGSGRRPHPEFRQRGRARERHRRRRLRLRHLRRAGAGRHQDRVDEIAVACRRRTAGIGAVVGQGGVTLLVVPARARSARAQNDERAMPCVPE